MHAHGAACGSLNGLCFHSAVLPLLVGRVSTILCTYSPVTCESVTYSTAVADAGAIGAEGIIIDARVRTPARALQHDLLMLDRIKTGQYRIFWPDSRAPWCNKRLAWVRLALPL
jgi:hypothetical protein